MNRSVYHILITVFTLSGLTFSAIAAWFYLQQSSLLPNTSSAQAVVIALAPRRSSEGGTLYAPIIRFSSQDGKNHEIETTTASSPPDYEVGERITVVYPNNQPEKAIIKGQNNFFIIIFGLLGFSELGTAAFLGLKIVNQNIQGQT
jgi:hypothetical protein